MSTNCLRDETWAAPAETWSTSVTDKSCRSLLTASVSHLTPRRTLKSIHFWLLPLIETVLLSVVRRDTRKWTIWAHSDRIAVSLGIKWLKLICSAFIWWCSSIRLLHNKMSIRLIYLSHQVTWFKNYNWEALPFQNKIYWKIKTQALITTKTGSYFTFWLNTK